MRRIQPDILLGMALGALLMLALSWCANNPHSPYFWRSYP